MKKFFSLCLLVVVGVAALAQARLVETVAATPGKLVIPYQKYVMPNGFTVLLTEDHSDPLVHVDVVYHVGSAREEIGKSGFAHFFEHMMFEGSDHVAAKEHFKIISAAGGTLNGNTTLDRTDYFETVPSNQLEKMLWLESDRMGFLVDAVTQQKFEIQRSTVKNERGQNYDNRPYGLTGEFTSKNLYPYGHPYSWLTIGYVEDLNRVNVDDLKNFFLRWYTPNNATLTIGGDFNSAQALKWVEKYFGGIPRGPQVTKTVLPPVVLENDRYASYVDNYAKLPILSKTYPTVRNYDKDMPALTCLAQVLGQGKNSILYQQLVKTQKALNASAFSRFNELAGEFTFQVTPYPGNSLTMMDSLLQASFTSFEKRGVTDDDIEKFRGGIEAQYINSLQSVSGKVTQLAAFQTYTGNPNMIGSQLDAYRAVTKEDVMRVYDKYIRGKHSVTVSVLVKGKNMAPVQADNYAIDSAHYVHPDYGYAKLKYVKAADNFDRNVQPPAGANPVVKVPTFTTATRPTGTSMIFSETKELPVVNIIIHVPGGQLAEQNDTSKAGLAAITAAMLNEDTKKYTAEQMAVELQKAGSSIIVTPNFDGINFNVQALAKNIDKTLALLEERLLRPDFTEAAFNRVQKQTLENFKQYKSQPAAIATQVFEKINYPNSVLGMNPNGTEASVARLTLQDVKDFYARTFTSRGTRVVVVGDVNEKDILPKLAFLDGLPDKAVSYPKPSAASPLTKSTVYLVDVPHASQTEFRIGMPTNILYDATGQFYRLGLLNYTLGGDFNSRLNIDLREDHGWTYGASSAFTANEYEGGFVFSSGIRNDAADSALTETMQVMKSFGAQGLKDDELVFMKNAIGQREARAYETGAQKAAFVSRILEYGLPANFTQQQNAIIQSMTKPELDALAKKWLNTDRMNVLLVGDKASLLPRLQKLGYTVVELDADGNVKS